jgi:2-polyprenyl-6-methoxyphenol hydroxylase-like FAD-dependent oxidoreductase
VLERARVVGADGLRSLVARTVGARQYNEVPPQLCGYYSYWSGLPVEGRFEVYVRDDRGFAAAPTNDGLTMVVGGWPYAELEANKADVEGNYMTRFERAPGEEFEVMAQTIVRWRSARAWKGQLARTISPSRS